MLFLSSFCLFFFPSPSSRNIETEVIQIFRFGQVTRMGWQIYRIDESTAPLERREQMNLFQTGGDNHEALCLFLLNTRVGGSGFNLVATDTVIFHDQDWVWFHILLQVRVRCQLIPVFPVRFRKWTHKQRSGHIVSVNRILYSFSG